MKTTSLIFAALALALASCQTPAPGDPSASAPDTQALEQAGVRVYYFHGSHRCATCQAVEQVTGDFLRAEHGQELSSGQMAFEVFDLDTPEGQAKAEQMGVSGQTLLVVSGQERLNLTNEAFLNARNSPEKLQQKLAETLAGLN